MTGKPGNMIGKLKKFTSSALALLALLAAGQSFASDVNFTAEVDRDQISVDETVTLRIKIETENSAVGDPQVSAPDFDLLNQYNAVQSQSYCDESTGRIGMRNSIEVSKVLKPQKTGTLHIKGIAAQVGRKTYR